MLRRLRFSLIHPGNPPAHNCRAYVGNPPARHNREQPDNVGEVSNSTKYVGIV